MNRFIRNAAGVSIILVAMACSNGSTLAPSEQGEPQTLAEQPASTAEQGSNLHVRRESQIDSVIKDFTLDSTTISFGTLFYWKNLDDATHFVRIEAVPTPEGQSRPASGNDERLASVGQLALLNRRDTKPIGPEMTPVRVCCWIKVPDLVEVAGKKAPMHFAVSEDGDSTMRPPNDVESKPEPVGWIRSTVWLRS